MAEPGATTEYDSFSREDLISLVMSTKNNVDIYQKEMAACQDRINTLNKEKKDLSGINMDLSQNFSILEAFISGILGQKAMKDVRDKENKYDLDLMKSKFYDGNSDLQTLKENNENLMAKI